MKPLMYRLWITPRNGGGVELPVEIDTAANLLGILASLLAITETGPLSYRIEIYRPLD